MLEAGACWKRATHHVAFAGLLPDPPKPAGCSQDMGAAARLSTSAPQVRVGGLCRSHSCDRDPCMQTRGTHRAPPPHTSVALHRAKWLPVHLPLLPVQPSLIGSMTDMALGRRAYRYKPSMTRRPNAQLKWLMPFVAAAQVRVRPRPYVPPARTPPPGPCRPWARAV